jgi:adenine-specific DNA-methyltransferase
MPWRARGTSTGNLELLRPSLRSAGPSRPWRYRREEATRKNIPTAEYQSVMEKGTQDPVRVAYERRNRDLDPQLVWRGKDEQDWSDLVVHAPSLYIQEKVVPKVLIDDLLRRTRDTRNEAVGAQPDLFAEFNGLPEGADKTDFYRHDQNWSNRMILGDSLQVMASKVQTLVLKQRTRRAWCRKIQPRSSFDT